ncbi:MAG TPA: 50S ribosomal protein L9 [Rhodothermales bacterium]|nr:50S ribosomal protein L9 [Rhodothermales bacterium]
MKVILKQDVENLGSQGDVVTVRDGYGRNYLIPRGLALTATRGAVQAHEEEQKQAGRKTAAQLEAAQSLAQRLESTEVVIRAKVGGEDRLFGSITSQQVAARLAQEGIEVDRRNVDLGEDIRRIGVYTATVKLHRDVTAQVKVHVVPEESATEA